MLHRHRASLVLASTLALAACGTRPPVPAPAPSAAATSAAPPPVDAELVACRARVAAVEGLPAQPGAPALDAARPEFLGRVRGEPMVFVREPRPAPDEGLPPAWLASRRAFERAAPGVRVASLRARHRHDPAALRALALREGYAYAPEPLDALALVTELSLADLFAEPAIWIQRGADTRRLERTVKRSEITYRYVDGPLAGRAADLLFGDRVAVGRGGARRAAPPRPAQPRRHGGLRPGDPGPPHRRGAARGAPLRGAAGPRPCSRRGARRSRWAASRRTRRRAPPSRPSAPPTGVRRRALLAMHDVVSEELSEALRFDRPEGEKTAEHDGELRPVWLTAYLQGRPSFQYQGASYPVFDGAGKAWPPEVCVDFVLDSFERASGTWFAPRGGRLQRVRGRLDFDDERHPQPARRDGVRGVRRGAAGALRDAALRRRGARPLRRARRGSSASSPSTPTRCGRAT